MHPDVYFFGYKSLAKSSARTLEEYSEDLSTEEFEIYAPQVYADLKRAEACMIGFASIPESAQEG